MILFILALFLGFYGVVSNPPATANDYSIGIVATVGTILILYAVHEYLQL